MTSFLATCAQCGTMGPKTGRCPQCGHSETAIDDVGATAGVASDFAHRYAQHARNKGIEMMLGLALGFVGLITAFLWLLVIYRGNILALLLVGVFSIATGVLTAVRFFSERWFPTELLCPSCSCNLAALNDIGEECPACHAILRVTLSAEEVAQAEAEAEMAAAN